MPRRTRRIRKLGTNYEQFFLSRSFVRLRHISKKDLDLALVLALFEFSGLIWNTASVSYRQRTIPDELLGRENSVYRLLAWGMMPIGLLLSGLIVSAAAVFTTRDVALTMPFYAAAGGAALLTMLAWKPLGKGFAAIDKKRKPALRA